MTLACEALSERNMEKAEFVVHNDDAIDHLELMVHKTASDLIMRYQPISQDLRQILASMRVASDLERIGDTAESIARRVVGLGDKPMLAVRRIGALAALVLERFNSLVEAYETRSVINADDIREHDEDVDNAYMEASGDILLMMESDPSFVRTGRAAAFDGQILRTRRRPPDQRRRADPLRNRRQDRVRPTGRGVGQSG